jgi:hypothetical protein
VPVPLVVVCAADYGNNFPYDRYRDSQFCPVRPAFAHRRAGPGECCRSYTATAVSARSRGANFRL